MASDSCELDENEVAEVVNEKSGLNESEKTVVEEKQVADFVDMVTIDASIQVERNYNSHLLKKNLRAAEGMLLRREMETAANDLVNELFLTCIGTTFAGGDGKSCPEKKIAAPKRGRKRKIVEEPTTLKLLK